jgi:peptidyl-prolyl cis-trans isomerase B (cyclophilin B)
MLQLSPLTAGEELAIIHTNHGDITLRFFPEEAPLAVENFVTHARNGYYDGSNFHRVINDFMIQGGTPQGAGRGGESIWGEPFGLERSFNLLHLRGALATAHAGPNTIGSQFYIVQNENLDEAMIHQFQYLMSIRDTIAGAFSNGRHIYVRDIYPEEGLRSFIENGGTPWLDWHWNRDRYGHTVFGHVVEGMDVVDAIAAVEVHTDRARQHLPVEDVIIERISFVIYGE